jgi:hypothetical protein
MEMLLARKLQDMDTMELIQLLTRLRTEDNGAYEVLRQLIEDS